MTNNVATDFGEDARAVFTSDFFRQMWIDAWGDQYVVELETLSTTTWRTLGLVVGGLRLKPDDLLVDLGCGRGGPGLWLARAFNARLVGIDHMPPLVDLATEWAKQWLPPGRASFQIGTLADTGLATGSADGVFSNSISIAPDMPLAIGEVGRILRPGGRLAFTINENLNEDHEAKWRELLAAAGMTFEERHEMPEAVRGFRRLTDTINADREGLIQRLGVSAAAQIFADGDAYGPLLDRICWSLVVARRD